LRISQKNLPEVKELGANIGSTVDNNIFAFKKEIPIYSCGNDQTAGAYGADLKKGDILITLGTAQIAYSCCDTMPFPRVGLFRGTYLNDLFYAMFAENGGAIISQLLELFPEFKDFDTFANFAEKGDLESKVVFSIDPVKNLPYWNNNSANLADKALAVFIYLAKRIEIMVANLHEICDIDGDIFITGGGTQNHIWVDLIEKALNRKVNLIETSPLLGATKMIMGNNKGHNR
jgi:sugar (pentulose or hexulose) kinase